MFSVTDTLLLPSGSLQNVDRDGQVYLSVVAEALTTCDPPLGLLDGYYAENTNALNQSCLCGNATPEQAPTALLGRGWCVRVVFCVVACGVRV